MQLAELLKEWPCTVTGGSIRVEVTGVEDDARKVKLGDVYVARKGKQTHGKKYIKQAIDNGAVAIVIEDERLEINVPKKIAVVWVPSCLKFLSYASSTLHGHPSQALKVIAITGTNGKTTTSHLVGQLLNALGKRVAVLGTVGFFIDGEKQLATQEQLTTLQAKELHPMIQYCLHQKIEYIVLEASSQGLAQHRLNDCDIDVGVFLNVSEDHLEEHGGIEEYKRAKAILGTMAHCLVLNGDDSFCRTIAMDTMKRRVFFGESSRVDIQLQLLLEGEQHATCAIQTKGSSHLCTIPFVGSHNRQNVLAAITTLWQLGFPLKDICSSVSLLQLPEGRLQLIENQFGIHVYVDYAHTAAALKAVLQSVKRKEGQLLVVFSCGGERDRQKRIEMGAIASQYADMIFLTTDNPRRENPFDINQQIVAGFTHQQCYDIILDRKKAIEEALFTASAGDVVVIAGKGHEDTQIFENTTIPFSDLAVVEHYFSSQMKDGI